jgi:hypothetical protein
MELQGNSTSEFWRGIDKLKSTIQFNEKDLHPDLFFCPKDKFPYKEGRLSDIETCESYNAGEGCKFLKKCEIYKKRKKAEKMKKLVQKNEVQSENSEQINE